MSVVKNIPILDLNERLNEFQDYLKRQIIPDPPAELLTIYEKRILHDHSYLRAEKYDSPEHQEELKKIQAKSDNPNKVPRNIQNPNYDKLMNFHERIVTALTIPEAHKIIIELHEFMNSFDLIRKFQFQPVFLEVDLILDPRFFEQEPDLPLYLNYLLTKVRNRIAIDEFKALNHLTHQKFDDESIIGALHVLRDAREKPNDYIALSNQILEAIGEKPNYQLKPPQKTNPIKKPTDYPNLTSFFNDLYLSYS